MPMLCIYGGQVPESIPAYITVRDSNLDTSTSRTPPCRSSRHYEESSTKMKAARTIEDPPIPDEKNTKPPVVPLAMHDLYKKLIGGCSTGYVPICRRPHARLRYALGCAHAQPSPVARGACARLGDIADAYCGSQSQM